MTVQRQLLDRWLREYDSASLDEFEFTELWSNEMERREIEVFVSPFEQSAALTDLLLQAKWSERSSEKHDESVLLEALRHLVVEMEHNARTVGHDAMADSLRDITEFRWVHEISRPFDLYPLDEHVRVAVLDAVTDAVFDLKDNAVANLYMVTGTWPIDYESSVRLMQPFIDLDLRFEAFQRLWSLGGDSLVTSDTALVAGPVVQPPSR